MTNQPKKSKARGAKTPRQPRTLKNLASSAVANAALRNKISSEEKQIKAIKRKLDGPKSQISQKVSVVVGYIRANTPNDVALQRSCWTYLNPLLLKDFGDGSTATPINITAEQYTMWRVNSVRVRCDYLVGMSAVSGTIAKASIIQNTKSSPVTIAAVNARVHSDINIGRTHNWNIPPQSLRGPRQGWWMTNTSATPAISLGPLFETFTYGVTQSTYKATQYTGNLFMVTLELDYSFTNYSPQPGLGSMSALTGEATGTLAPDSDGNLQLTVTRQQALSLGLLADLDTLLASGSNAASLGQTLFAVADAAAAAAAAIPGWGWLVAGGWYFLRLFIPAGDQSNTTTNIFKVYAGADEAANDSRVAVGASFPSTEVSGIYDVRQLTAPNTGSSAPVTTLSTQPIPPKFPITEGEFTMPTLSTTGNKAVALALFRANAATPRALTQAVTVFDGDVQSQVYHTYDTDDFQYSIVTSTCSVGVAAPYLPLFSQLLGFVTVYETASTTKWPGLHGLTITNSTAATPDASAVGFFGLTVSGSNFACFLALTSGAGFIAGKCYLLAHSNQIIDTQTLSGYIPVRATYTVSNN